MVHLNNNNMALHGFSRFYYKGEEQVINNIWLRDVEIGKSDGKANTLQVVLQSEQLILLPSDKENKIITWGNFLINSGNDSVTPINILSRRAGWNQTVEDIKRIVHVNPNASFIAALKEGNINITLGSGVVLQVSEELSWIGMILVHPELRRQGIANTIMKHCIEFARLQKGMHILGLDATPMGQPLYTSLGFKESFRIYRSIISTTESLSVEETLPIEPLESIKSTAEYLMEKSLSDKIKLFECLFNLYREGCFIIKSKGKINGFIMSRPGRSKPYLGYLVADSAKYAKALLYFTIKYWKLKGAESVFLDIPENHFEMKPVLNKSGNMKPQNCILHNNIKSVREFIRMYQLINYEEIESLANIKFESPDKIKAADRYKKVLQNAANSYDKTANYIKLEKSKVLPYLYSTGGPEFS